MSTSARATVEELYHVPEHGKAEIVNGEIVLMSPTGGLPALAAGAMYASLRQYQKTVGGGRPTRTTPASSSTFPIGNPSAPMPPFIAA